MSPSSNASNGGGGIGVARQCLGLRGGPPRVASARAARICASSGPRRWAKSDRSRAVSLMLAMLARGLPDLGRRQAACGGRLGQRAAPSPGRTRCPAAARRSASCRSACTAVTSRRTCCARRDAERPDARLRLCRVVGEGEHGHPGGARDRRDGGGLAGGERPQDQADARGERGAGGGGGACRRAAGVLARSAVASRGQRARAAPPAASAGRYRRAVRSAAAGSPPAGRAAIGAGARLGRLPATAEGHAAGAGDRPKPPPHARQRR